MYHWILIYRPSISVILNQMMEINDRNMCLQFLRLKPLQTSGYENTKKGFKIIYYKKCLCVKDFVGNEFTRGHIARRRWAPRHNVARETAQSEGKCNATII